MKEELGKCSKCGATQFLSYGSCNYNGVCKGKVIPFTSREKAMNWWNLLSSINKTQICDTHTELVGSVRRWETLTGREIEMIFEKENKVYQQK